MRKTELRIIDANLNRLGEGLRVLEDIIRFHLNNKSLTKGFKSLRHETGKLKGAITAGYDTLGARDVSSDVGKTSSKSEASRSNFIEIFSANIERSKESLRVLEEILKLTSPKLAEDYKKIRFRLYALEKKSIPKIKSFSQ